LDLASPRIINFQRNNSSSSNTAHKNESGGLSSETPTSTQPGIVAETVPIGDLADAIIILDADMKLMSVYGDYAHPNDGSHLDGGIEDHHVWQE
jgi:hypothetical protein